MVEKAIRIARTHEIPKEEIIVVTDTIHNMHVIKQRGMTNDQPCTRQSNTGSPALCIIKREMCSKSRDQAGLQQMWIASCKGRGMFSPKEDMCHKQTILHEHIAEGNRTVQDIQCMQVENTSKERNFTKRTQHSLWL